MKKNLFLTFCFSLIPGAGQMYQGYMKKGISLLTLLAIAIAIASFTNINIFSIPIPIIFAYSFFDTYNLRNKMGTENQEEDKSILENEELVKVFGSFKVSKKNSFIGICLILIGLYILMNSVFMNIASRYNIVLIEEIIRTVTKYLLPVIIAAFSIVLGIKFISNNNNK